MKGREGPASRPRDPDLCIAQAIDVMLEKHGIEGGWSPG